MATRRNKEDENLDAKHFEHVIKMLDVQPDGSKPWTKKEACAYLNITYNTTRLGSLIEKYKEKKAADAARRLEKRGKPATEAEISYVIREYLDGATVDAIATSLYRTPLFVKFILTGYDVPIRQSAHSYFSPELVPEGAMRDKFTKGELVYSMRYDSLAVVKSEFSPRVYCLYLKGEKWKQFCYQPAEELASLEHLKKYIYG